MSNPFWIALQRRLRRRRRGRGQRRPRIPSPAVVSLLAGFMIAAGIISLLELRLRPIVSQLATHQVSNRVIADLNTALGDLDVRYGELVTIHRDDAGAIHAITSDMAGVNQLRRTAVEAVLRTIAAIDVNTLGVPLGSLFDLDLLWATGPVIHVHSLVAGTVRAEVHSDFRSTGINQTLHRVLLDITVPITILLPGERAATEVGTSVCVAETVIVGQVPDTYLNLYGGNTDGRETGSGAAAAGIGTGGL